MSVAEKGFKLSLRFQILTSSASIFPPANGFSLFGNLRHSCHNYIKCFPNAFSLTWPFVTGGYNLIGSFQLLSTQTSSDKENVTDEVLNEVIGSAENCVGQNLEIYAECIEKLCRDRKISLAGQIMHALHDKGIFLGPDVYCHLLDGAAERNDIDLCCQVFKSLLMSCGSVSAALYLNFAKVFITTNDSVRLLGFVREVSDLTSQKASILRRMVIAFAKSKQIDKALLIYDYMNRQKCGLDLVMYNIVLDALGRAGRVDEMLQEFKSMKEAGITPDFISYNTLINSLRKVGKSDACLAYFKEMCENGIRPDLLTYTALIESCGRSGNIEESLKYFKEMKMKGIRPSIYIYRSLIHNLNKVGKVELASILLKEMNSCLTSLAGPKDFKKKRRS